MLLVPYKERMESFDRGFLVVSSDLVALLLSLNKSRSPWTDPDTELPPGACVGVLTALLELTCKNDMGLSLRKMLKKYLFSMVLLSLAWVCACV